MQEWPLMRSYTVHLKKGCFKISDVDLNSHLTAEQKAIGRAFQTLVEDNLYWSVVMPFSVTFGSVKKKRSLEHVSTYFF